MSEDRIKIIDNEIERRRNLLSQKPSRRSELLSIEKDTGIEAPEDIFKKSDKARARLMESRRTEHPEFKKFLGEKDGGVQAFVAQKLSEQLSSLYSERDSLTRAISEQIRAKEEEILALQKEYSPKHEGLSIKDYSYEEDDLPEWLSALIRMFKKRSAYGGFN